MFSNYTRSLLPFTHTRLHFLSTHPARKPLPHLLRRHSAALTLLVVVFFLAVATVKTLLRQHPAVYLSQAPQQMRTIPVLGHWRQLRHLVTSSDVTLRIPLPPVPISDIFHEAISMAEGEEAEESIELFLAPDALEHEPDMTLEEVDAWARSYVYVSTSTPTEGKVKAGGAKKKRGLGGARRRAARLVNQD